jgi:hypothetical protein
MISGKGKISIKTGRHESLTLPGERSQRTLTSVQSSPLVTDRFHRLDFYIVLRKLIPKQQAFSQRIQEASMV